jgi:hypothetical protein
MTTETAPNGRQTVTFTDFRDVVRAIDDVPVGAPAQRTLYNSDGMEASKSSTRRGTSRRTPTTCWAGARQRTRPMVV